MCAKEEREERGSTRAGATKVTRLGVALKVVHRGRDEGGTSWVVRKVARPTQEGSKPRGKISE